MRKTRSVLDRFHAFYITDDVTGCMIWTGAKSTPGYGQIQINGKAKSAHRFSFEQFVGPINDGLVIDHLCRVRACVNPDHLRQCTHRQNLLAAGAETLAARNAAKTHCVHGHEFIEPNIYWYKTRRYCRTCIRTRSSAR